jgi:preprotein translocase subunit SecA
LPAFLRRNPVARFARNVKRAMRRSKEIANLSDAEVGQLTLRLRAQMSRDGLAGDLIVEALGLVSFVSQKTLKIEPFESQLLAASVMLDDRLAEMATGEGKTLAAGLCAATAALAGVPVHVMTSNDYLVVRDAESLRPLYAALDLKVDFVTQAMSAERRRTAYRADITYCTAKELVFDYLRDTMVRRGANSDLHFRVGRMSSQTASRRELVMQGLCMAIVDEADSILIDEARVPLILSANPGTPGQYRHHSRALSIAEKLDAATDFRLDASRMMATLNECGRVKLEHIALSFDSVGRNRLHREELVCQAIAALYLYQRDKHYLVDHGTITIIDEMTGRLAPGRVWSRGLHQIIECKEDCQATDEQVTSAQITYQRFFQKYLRLGGMSGTLREARGELRAVYGLDVVRIPLRRPDAREILPTVIFPDRPAQYRAVVAEVQRRQTAGQPVLIGTDSVAESEQISACLEGNGIAHTVLNARQDKDEAEIVARAGMTGQVTVATNMAGRGTDIPLGPGAAERGGLHVISCQHNSSRRIDRQLVGRCARQGDPGSAQTFLCLEQPLLKATIPASVRTLVTRRDGAARPRWLIRLISRLPQMLEENRQRGQRRDLLKQDLELDQKLATIDGFE